MDCSAPPQSGPRALVRRLRDGRWQAGPVDEILDAQVLEWTYGCAWRSVEGAWLPA